VFFKAKNKRNLIGTGMNRSEYSPKVWIPNQNSKTNTTGRKRKSQQPQKGFMPHVAITTS